MSHPGGKVDGYLSPYTHTDPAINLGPDFVPTHFRPFCGRLGTSFDQQ